MNNFIIWQISGWKKLAGYPDTNTYYSFQP